MNKVIMMGRLVNEPELKTTPSGVAVCSFRIAVDRKFQKKGEERKSDFFNVVTWRATAEFVSRWFGKGRMILIEGELQTREYTDKNVNKNTWYEIIAENVYFTGEKAGGEQKPTAPPPPPPASGSAPAPAGKPAASDNTPPSSSAAYLDSYDYPF